MKNLDLQSNFRIQYSWFVQFKSEAPSLKSETIPNEQNLIDTFVISPKFRHA